MERGRWSLQKNKENKLEVSKPNHSDDIFHACQIFHGFLMNAEIRTDYKLFRYQSVESTPRECFKRRSGGVEFYVKEGIK